jgi:MFS transporter, SP family, sugar:H+ symporter
MVAGFLTRNFGRRMTIVILCIIALVGMIIQAATHNFWALMMGRLINSLSMGIEANCVPMYMAELAPASIRGALVNFYQCWLYVGAVIGASTVYGASTHLTGRWTYQTVIVAQLALPCLLLSAVWFIPESPRWLLYRGRRDDSLEALKYLRYGGATDEEVETELELMDQATQQEREQHLATSYSDCFKGSNGLRTLAAVGVQVLQQAQGNAFMTSYKVIFLKQLGMSQPLVIQVSSLCVSLLGTFLAFYLSDKLGRRPMLIGGSFFMAVLMWIISGMAAWLPGGVHGSAAQGAVACILIYVCFIPISYTDALKIANKGYTGCILRRNMGLCYVGSYR